MKLPSDFKELLEAFGRDGVEHVVIGGYAFAYHAEPRAGGPGKAQVAEGR